MNIYTVDEPVCVNWECIELWNQVPYAENAVLLRADQEMSQAVVDVKERQLKSLVSNDVFEGWVPFEDLVTAFSLFISEKYKRWWKEKARFVVCSFKEKNNHWEDSPT